MVVMVLRPFLSRNVHTVVRLVSQKVHRLISEVSTKVYNLKSRNDVLYSEVETASELVSPPITSINVPYGC